MKTILSFITIIAVLITVGCSKKTETVTPETPTWGTLTIVNPGWASIICKVDLTGNCPYNLTGGDSTTFNVPVGTGKFTGVYLFPGHFTVDTIYMDTIPITILGNQNTRIVIKKIQGK